MPTNILRSAAAAIAVLMATACSDASTAPTPLPNPTATLSITAPMVTVYEADAVVLTAVYRDADGNVVPNAPVTWSAQDTVRAQLGANGYVLALRSGVVQVTAKSGALTATYDLTIVRPAVTGVAVLLPTPTLSRGEVSTIGVRTDGPAGRVLLGRSVTLSSAHPDIATIDVAGRVRAVSAGVATIRATVEGVVGTAQITVTANDTELSLSHLDGNRLPRFVAGDSVMWDGVREYHEVYLETGTLTLSGSPLRYRLKLNYYQYNVVTVNGQRRLEPRAPQSQSDRGLVQYDARGDLQMTSEVFYPLLHVGTAVSGGMEVKYRIPGTDDYLRLHFRREPE